MEADLTELTPPRWRRGVLVALAVATLLGGAFSAALFLSEHYASAEDVERAATEHRAEHRQLDSRLESAEREGAINRALLERIEGAVERLDQRLTDYPIERHGR